MAPPLQTAEPVVRESINLADLVHGYKPVFSVPVAHLPTLTLRYRITLHLSNKSGVKIDKNVRG